MDVASEAVRFLDQESNRSLGSTELLEMLACLDDLLERAVEAAEQVYGAGSATDPYRGLYINQDEVARLFSQSPGQPRLNPEQEQGREQLRETLHEKLRANASMKLLVENFGLQMFDLKLILLALAPEVDLRYQRLFAYLQDDVTRRRPSFDLALNLFCFSVNEKLASRAHVAPESPLLREGLMRLVSDQAQNGLPLLSHYLKLDEQITEFLLGQRTLDPRLAPFCELVDPQVSLDTLPLGPQLKRALTSLVCRAKNDSQPLRLYFSGPCKWEKRPAAEAIAREAGLALLIVDLNQALATEAEFQKAVNSVFRQAWFQGALIYVDTCDALHSDNYSYQLRSFQNSLQRFNGIVVLAGERDRAPVETTDRGNPLDLIDVAFSIPRFAERRECWRSRLAAASVVLKKAELDLIAGRFRLTPTQISQAVMLGCNKSLWRAASDLQPNGSATQPTFSDFCAAARTQAQHQLGTLARKIEPLYTWDDIVLPKDALDQLHELCSRVAERRRVLGEWGFGRKLSLGKGVNALFAGPSGTGKTMAAEIVANDLQLELYKIDLSGIVSKYIGETEKNLDRIFTTAENANAILFFDEADALFGKRSEVRDSHDRYANIEISYLLQKMEQYEGIAILATNLRQNLDDAFLRRLQIVIEFPFPDEVQRRQIWKQLFPPESPRDEGIDFDLLARQFRIAGGNIKNIVLGSAFLAAADGGLLGMTHLLQSGRREYQKLGKVLT